MGRSRHKKRCFRANRKNKLNINSVRKQIKKLEDEALMADMMDNTSLMSMKLNEVEVLRSMLDEYKEG
tara:strand:- start:497 stop:700 length:204 start_codon:yes stop_codon:yes gene_type:complete